MFQQNLLTYAFKTTNQINDLIDALNIIFRANVTLSTF
jgi:hypothetical protein